VKSGAPLFVRVDATTATGMGHFARSLAIAQRWRDDYGPVTFIGTFDDALLATLQTEGINVAPLPGTHPDGRDIATTLQTIEPGAATVLDGYHFDYDYQRRLATHAHLLVIDDLGHQDRYAGAILLNANLNATEIAYGEAPARRLLGPRYAMLRLEIVAARERLRSPGGPVTQVLVSLGGADAANDTLRILEALPADTAAPYAVRVVAGPLNPHGESLRACAERRSGITIVAQPVAMADELVAADLVIASAGTISAELAFLGLPCILFAVADNQLGIGAAMQRAGAAIYGGDIRALDDAALAAALRAGLADDARRATMHTAGPALVDGGGPVRICRELGAGNSGE